MSSVAPITIEAPAPTPQESRVSRWGTCSVAAVAYAGLVLLMWLPYTANTGMPGETCFPYMSETSSTWWRGFLYTADPLRIHTNTFYHTSYLLADLLGIPGSFATYQIVYALLWWARGVLVYLILRRFLPDQQLFCFLVGALTLTHGADSALNFVGQLNQYGYLFWMAAGFYLLIHAYQSQRPLLADTCLVLAIFCEHMSLWSYESQIFILALLPLLLPFLPDRFKRRLLPVAGAWYLIIGLYVYQSLTRYLSVGGSTYQAGVMRADFTLPAILSDWWFNIRHSLSFWTWSGSLGDRAVEGAASYGLAAAGVVALGVVLTLVLRRTATLPGEEPGRLRVWLSSFVLGGVLLAFSFPVYLVLNSARMNWRTQFLGGFAAAMVVVGAAGLCVALLGRRKLAAIAGVAVCLAAVHFGTQSAVRFGAHHAANWDKQRPLVASVLEIAPRLKPDCVIVLLNVPSPESGRDPFSHCMWFDMALRLSYPKTNVAGMYFYDNGKPAPGNNLKIKGDEWEWDKTGFPPIVRQTKVSQTIVVDYKGDGNAAVLAHLPECVQPTEAAQAKYSPLSAIEPGPASPYAVRRYGPFRELPPATATREAQLISSRE